MKTKFLLLAVALLGFASVAQTPPVATETLRRIQTDPAIGTVSAYFEKSVTVDGVTYAQPWQSVTWALAADKTVTASGRTYSYSEIFSAVLAVAKQERELQLLAQKNAPPQ